MGEKSLRPTFQQGVLHFEADLIEERQFFIRHDRIYKAGAIGGSRSLSRDSNTNEVYPITSGPTDFCGLLFNSGITSPKYRTTRRSFIAIYAKYVQGINIDDVDAKTFDTWKTRQWQSSWPAYMQTKFFKRVDLNSQKTEVAGMLCYVMLIKWRGEFAERLAIGVIKYDAWMSIGGRQRQYIRLG